MVYDILVVCAVLLLNVVGIVGCVVPGLPGPLLNYAGILVLYFYNDSLSGWFMILWGVIVALTMVVEHLFPIWFSKKFGASKYGTWGSIIGMILGIFYTPLGMIFGMLLGAIVGELIGGSTGTAALKSGLATFTGTMFSMLMNLVVAITITIYAIVESVRVFW